ncbi:hypothetical protein F5Y15DRAFT_397587 [Xylariaceae sp. FL0016]|nr:hypothetical protein F5Y15DRAFT_397587 [Xylariaceae sp. FL0016]
MAASVLNCRGFSQPALLLLRTAISTSTTELPIRACPHSRWLWSPRLQRQAVSLAIARARYSTGNIAKFDLSPSQRQPLRPGATPGSNLDAARLAYAQRLASRSSPTTLYEGASQTGFIISSWFAGAFCITAAAINTFFNVYNVPSGVPGWVPYGFGSMSIILTLFGSNFVLRPSSVVRSIKLLPKSTTAARLPASRKPSSANPPVLFEIKARRMTFIPGIPLKTLLVEPQSVVMRARMHYPSPSPQMQQMQQEEEKARRKAEREYEMSHIMTAPFRHAGSAFGSFFRAIRRGITGEGFAPIYIQGAEYKLDITDGYVYENGQALDRLVKVEEDATLARQASKSPDPGA